jgi:hypothetical protein
VSELAFLSPYRTSAEAVWRSPLARVLHEAPAGISDISRTGKIELRGDLEELDAGPYEIVWITPRRALVLCDYDKTAELHERLRERFLAIDMTGALAGLEVRGEQLLRRLTDLDLETLPAVGPVAHVQAIVLRDDEETFRLFFPQEYGHYLAEVVTDLARGLTR